MEGCAESSDQAHLPLPENYLPKSWWIEDEISYFFSPFRSYKQNPSDKDNKIKFWKPIILRWCEHSKRCTFVLSELEKTFTKNQLVPACLSGVVDDMLRKHQICPKEEFLLVPCQTWSGWALDLLIKKPVGWSIQKAKEFIIKTEDEKVYVVIEAVKFQANILLMKRKNSGKGLLLSKAEVEKLVSDLRDLDVILHWLICQHKIVRVSYKDGELIKFCGNEERVSAISEIDIGIYDLQQTEKTLNNHIQELETERLTAIQTAKMYIAKEMKQMAKSSLRRKREIEKSLDKRASVLENVQALLTRIKESHSDAKILETYQKGLAALKCTLKETNLTDDNVSKTVFEINEVLDIYSEIQESMSQTVESSNEQELEEELAKLLLSDVKPTSPEVTINVTDLPDVPNEKPSESTMKTLEACL